MDPRYRRRLPWARLFAVWLGLAIVMIGHGWLRQWLAVPALGELRAHQLSCLTGSLIVVAVAALTLGWLGAVGSRRRQLAIGLVWLATTVLFEFVFGHWVAGHSWERLLADYDLSAGRLWLVVLAATLLGPWLAGRLRPAAPRPHKPTLRDGRALVTAAALAENPEGAVWNAFVELLALSEPGELSAAQRPAQRAFWYDAELQNGGHLQYFLNRGIEEPEAAVPDLEALGAAAFGELLAEAVERWRSVERAAPATAEEYVEIARRGELDDLDARFYALEPTMHEILERHLEANRERYLVIE